jgi:hypothetical protein
MPLDKSWVVPNRDLKENWKIMLNLLNQIFFMETMEAPIKLRVVDTKRTNELIEVDSHYEITAEESQVMRCAYRDGTLKRNSKTIGKKDSTSIFFSKHLLERLIEVADEAASARVYLNPGMLVH